MQPAQSLGDLNTWFGAWVEEHYHRRVHGTTGETPVARWGTGGGHRAVPLEQIRAAFRVEVTRRVDKTGQVRWQGARWIVPEGLLQTTVQLRYDPYHPEILEVWQDGIDWGRAVPSTAAVPDPGGAPPPPAAPSSGLSYLAMLTAQQRARRPGVPYHHEEEDSR